MLEYFDERDIEITNVEDADINKYATTQKQGKGTVFRGALVKFFAVVQAPRFHIDSFTAQKSKDQVERKARILSVREIIKIRNKLTTKDAYKLLFAFEIFFTHGVTLDEIEQFGEDHYSVSENVFTFISKGKTKKIKMSELIAELINKKSDLLKQKGRAKYSTYMQDISDIVQFEGRDKIIWGDIRATRDALFPTCPHCNEKYPNSAEFWALVEFEEDTNKTHWIYCKDCAAKMQKDA